MNALVCCNESKAMLLSHSKDFNICSYMHDYDNTTRIKVNMVCPTLFSLYSFSIADIARKHGLSVHLYADDTQIYIMFNQDDTVHVNAISRIEACVAEIKSWMITNKLMLNEMEIKLKLLCSVLQVTVFPIM